MKIVQVLDKKFYQTISYEEIQTSITKIANKMNDDLKNEDVIFLGILNGAFLFAADLFKQIEFDSQISFLKVASYSGTSTSGTIKRLIGLNENIANKTVIVLEDIIDSGITMEFLLKQLRGYEPKKILIATMLFKPEAFEKDYEIHYKGIEIPNDFIVGYGLDYDGFGRNLKNIYTLLEE